MTGLVVLPNGQAVSAGAEGSLHVWEPGSGHSRYRVWVGGEGILSLALSPDGRQLVAGCKDGAARVWDANRLNDPRHGYLDELELTNLFNRRLKEELRKQGVRPLP
jgi:WD40 repeat protein